MASAFHSPFGAQVEVWGLTGGIAAGKSTAAKFFAEAGIPVVDADEIARELSREGGAAQPLIAKRFGAATREKLRELVFADPQARKDLEAILHPLIRAESVKRMTGLKGPVIYEAALLVETGRYRELSGLITVEAPEDVRKRRLIARSGCPAELADRIIASQAPSAERRQAAAAVFENASGLDHLRKQVTDFIAARGW